MGCSNLESVTLDNNNVQNDANNNDCKIGQMAFMGCINLQRICIPETIRNIDRYAFLGCTSLISRDNDELRIPNSVTDIGEYAFMGCLSLNKLTIPDRTTNIHNYALMGCINLNTLSMPRNVILGHHAIIGDFIENIIYRDIV